jgi:drug/metabolite transporter (DMT)-like permease
VAQALLFGLCAALAWGVSDSVTAVLGRRGGSFAVLVTAHTAATVWMTALFFLVVDEPGLTAAQLAAALGLGVLSVLTYTALFRALELGPLSIVSPVVASWVAVTLLLAVVVLAEPLSAVQAAGCVLIVGGVVFGSTRSAPPGGGPSSRRSGLVFAVAAMGGLGLYNFLLGDLSQHAGWFLPLYVSRGAGAAIMVGIVVARRDWPWRRMDRRTLALTALVPGLVASLGGMAFNRGAELGHVSVTSAVASIYPLIPVAASVVLLRERLGRNQLAGLGTIVAGLVVIALTS